MLNEVTLYEKKVFINNTCDTSCLNFIISLWGEVEGQNSASGCGFGHGGVGVESSSASKHAFAGFMTSPDLLFNPDNRASVPQFFLKSLKSV